MADRGALRTSDLMRHLKRAHASTPNREVEVDGNAGGLAVDAPRFDNLAKLLAAGLSRRRVLVRLGGAAAALFALRGAVRPAGAATSRQVTAPICTYCYCPSSCPPDFENCLPCEGVAGGGTVRLASGEEAILALSVLETQSPDQGEGANTEDQPRPAPVGLLRWADPAASLTLESVGLCVYEPVRDLPGVREVRGSVRANGASVHPFVLRLADVGPDGRGQDTVALAVGDEVPGAGQTGLAYAAEGVLVAGDLVGTWTLTLPTDAATPAP
jgi:hypothetical protein